MLSVRADTFGGLSLQCHLQLELSGEATTLSLLHSHILCHQPPVAIHFSPLLLLTLLISILIQTLLNIAETPRKKKKKKKGWSWDIGWRGESGRENGQIHFPLKSNFCYH